MFLLESIDFSVTFFRTLVVNVVQMFIISICGFFHYLLSLSDDE